MTDIQYISDANGNPVGVIVPIEIWHEIESEKENGLSDEKRNNEKASARSQRTR